MSNTSQAGAAPMAGQVGDDETALRRTYQREAHVESQIAELTARGLSWAVEQVSKRGIGWKTEVYPEVVVYLIRRCVAEKKKLFVNDLVQALWEFCHPVLVRWIDRLGPDIRGEASQDVIDEVLTDAFQAWLSDAPGQQFWEIRFSVPLRRRLLAEVLRTRKAMERLAEQYALKPSGDEVDVIDELVAPGVDMLDQVAISNALAAMNEHWARSFVLCRIEGMSDDEAAEILGVTGRTIRNYIQHAVNALRQALLPGEVDS